MRAVIYLRVSTDSTEQGLGMEAQRHACELWAAREGVETVGPFGDDISGASPLDKRVGLADALGAVGKGDVLLAAKRDRLGREPMVIAVIEAAVIRKGGRVVSAAGEGTDDDDPTNVLMRRIVDAFAEYERLIIKARTRAALAAKRRKGERVGPTPFGMTLVDDGRRSKTGNLPSALVENPDEAAVVAEVRNWHQAGWSIRRICRELDARGVRPKRGGAAWSPASVSKLIRRSA